MKVKFKYTVVYSAPRLNKPIITSRQVGDLPLNFNI